MSRLTTLLVPLALLLPVAVQGQVGTTTDILTGVVIGMDDAPLVGAQVEVTAIETRITRRQLTDARGRYTIVFPDGGGQYQLVVHSIGLAPQRRHSQAALDAARAVLTPEQWNKLPDALKRGPRGPGGRRG